MKNTISIAIKLLIFAGLTFLGIIYVINQSPIDSMPTYEKQEMVRPNRGTSVIDDFFKSNDKNQSHAADSDDVSLMGTSGRYEEVRIGKSSPNP